MARKEIEYDPETNLPKLPDGLFWKINHRSGCISIEVVEEVTKPQHTFLFFKWGYETKHHTYEGLYTYLSEDELSNEDIQGSAEGLYRKLVSINEKADRIKELVGIYPPKSLI